MTATVELNRHAAEVGVALPAYRPLPIPALDIGGAEDWAAFQGWRVSGWVRTATGYRALLLQSSDPIGRIDVVVRP